MYDFHAYLNFVQDLENEILLYYWEKSVFGHLRVMKLLTFLILPWFILMFSHVGNMSHRVFDQIFP